MFTLLNSEYLLTDEQMIEFISKGFLVLQNDLPEQLHQDVMNKIYYVMHEEGNPGNNILPRVPEIQQLFETSTVKGALTSVLGPDYYMHPHRHCHYNQPGNQTPGGGQWHKDGYWSSMRSHRPWWAMIFYYTHDITEDLGPTAIMPGTQYYEKFLGDKGETLLPTGKAGTMVLVHFDLWHKASLNVSKFDRYMLKFQFARLKEPEYPSWNHKSKDMVVPEDVPFVHSNLWQDVWDWLRSEKTKSTGIKMVDDSDLSQLKAELNAEDAFVRGRAADQIGLMGEAGASLASELGRLLSDTVEGVALNAAYALGHIGQLGAQELLDQLAVGSNLISKRAAYGLQGAGSIVIPGLIETLHHKEEKKRALAAFVLGMLGSHAREAVPTLIKSLKDESQLVRRNIIESLGMIVHPADHIVPELVKALEESVLEESSNSAKSRELNDINQPYIINKIGYTAALSLLRTGKEDSANIVVQSLERALNSKDRYIRAYVAEALSHLRTEDSIDVLIRFCRSSRWCADTHKASTF
ncbi:HEAT repeat domain-containing protein [Neobacillus niacini]|uniref:HEAT repeat domain-containing protein n=1 Tax=Neobacillus niacini TaxID=86668 RepID=UPI001EE6E98E|nr:HEAT repeat domain-containing protein [Neobacillus niacini]